MILSSPLSTLPSVSSTGDTKHKTEKKRQIADVRGGNGVREEPNHTTKESLVLYKIQYPLFYMDVSQCACTVDCNYTKRRISCFLFVKSIVASVLYYLYNQYACTVLVNVPYSWVSLQSFLSITLA